MHSVARIPGVNVPHVMIGLPVYERVEPQCMASIFALQQQLLMAGVESHVHYLIGCAVIAVARNALANIFLKKTHASHLLFLDADIQFDPQTVARMLLQAKPFMAVACPRRTAMPPGRADVQMSHAFQGADRVTEVSAEGFLRVKRVGGAFVLLERQALEKLSTKAPVFTTNDPNSAPEEQFAFFESRVQGGEFVAEDYWLCDRWRELGGEIWIDATARTFHVGRHSFGPESVLDVLQSQECERKEAAE